MEGVVAEKSIELGLRSTNKLTTLKETLSAARVPVKLSKFTRPEVPMNSSL